MQKKQNDHKSLDYVNQYNRIYKNITKQAVLVTMENYSKQMTVIWKIIYIETNQRKQSNIKWKSRNNEKHF